MRSGLRHSDMSLGLRLPVRTRAIRVLAALALLAPLAACDTISSMNPFDKNETYKPEIIPEVPAEQLYNEGLGYLAEERLRIRGEALREPGPPVSVLELGQEGADSPDLRQFLEPPV